MRTPRVIWSPSGCLASSIPGTEVEHADTGVGSSPGLGAPLDLAFRPIGRPLHPSVRSPPRHFHPLACLLPDRSDGDLGVLAQHLDVPGDLAPLAALR